MAPRGRLLALEPLQAGFLLLRPVVRALGGELSPWRGKMFDHGGNSGQNLVFGRRVTRFRALVAPSYVDGQPALQLRYDEPAFGNPWPVRNLVDELRTLSDGVAMGPILFASANGERHVVAWFGLERAT